MKLKQQEQIMQLTTSWERKGRLEEKLAITLRLLHKNLILIPSSKPPLI
jgi:hypothetical protein